MPLHIFFIHSLSYGSVTSRKRLLIRKERYLCPQYTQRVAQYELRATVFVVLKQSLSAHSFIRLFLFFTLSLFSNFTQLGRTKYCCSSWMYYSISISECWIKELEQVSSSLLLVYSSSHPTAKMNTAQSLDSWHRWLKIYICVWLDQMSHHWFFTKYQ